MAANPPTVSGGNDPPGYIQGTSFDIAVDISSATTINDVATALVNAINGSNLLNGTMTASIDSNSSYIVNMTADTVGPDGNNITLTSAIGSITKSGVTFTGGGTQENDYVNRINDDLILFSTNIMNRTKIGEVVNYFTGSTDINNIGFVSGNTICIEKHNKELHLGTGNTEVSKTKWIGTPQKISFNEDNEEARIVTDGELKPPANTDFFSKVVANNDGAYLYGHRWKGSTLYMIKTSDGSIERRSTVGQFTDLRSLDYYTTGGKDYLWVFDAGASQNGTLFLLDANSLEPVRVCPLQNYSPSGWVSDIIMTADKIWVSHSAVALQTEKMLYSASIPNASGSLTLTDNTFNLSDYAYGHTFVWGSSYDEYLDNSGYEIALNTSFRVGKRSLCRIGSAAVGWLVKYSIEDSNHLPNSVHVYGDSITWDPDNSSLDNIVESKLYSGYFLLDIPESYTSDPDNATTGRIKLYSISDPDNATDITSIFQDSSHFCWTTENKMRETSALTHVAPSSSNTKGTISAAKDDSFDDATGFVSSSFSDSLTFNYIWYKYSGTSKIKKIYFNTAGNLVENDILGDGNNVVVTVANAGYGSSFPIDVSHSWRMSYTYDNYQESPLAEAAYSVSSNSVEDKNITIVISDIDKLSKRISHVNIYRSSDNSYYRLIKSIRADDAAWVNTTDVKRTIVVIDDYNASQSFESRTGISEAMTTFDVNYGLSTQINNNLIIGDCFHTEIDDAEFYLFKSKSYRYNTFNWATDYLRLPEKPTVLQAYNGRVYAFTANKMFRINPDNMTTEDTFDGIGCISPKSIIVTEYGMFFASDDNIYMHNGQQPTPIGDSILRDQNNFMGWQDNTKTFVNLSFDSKRTSLLCFFTMSSGSFCWAFNLPRKRWDLWDAPKAIGTFIGKTNEVLVTSGSNLYEYLGGSSQRQWKWESKSITLGQDTQDKMFYKIRGIGDSHTLKYKVLNGSWSGDWQVPTSERIASSDKKSKAIKLQLVPTSNTNEIDSVGIIFRRRPVR